MPFGKIAEEGEFKIYSSSWRERDYGMETSISNYMFFDIMERESPRATRKLTVNRQCDLNDTYINQDGPCETNIIMHGNHPPA